MPRSHAMKKPGPLFITFFTPRGVNRPVDLSKTNPGSHRYLRLGRVCRFHMIWDCPPRYCPDGEPSFTPAPSGRNEPNLGAGHASRSAFSLYRTGSQRKINCLPSGPSFRTVGIEPEFPDELIVDRTSTLTSRRTRSRRFCDDVDVPGPWSQPRRHRPCWRRSEVARGGALLRCSSRTNWRFRTTRPVSLPRRRPTFGLGRRFAAFRPCFGASNRPSRLPWSDQRPRPAEVAVQLGASRRCRMPPPGAACEGFQWGRPEALSSSDGKRAPPRRLQGCQLVVVGGRGPVRIHAVVPLARSVASSEVSACRSTNGRSVVGAARRCPGGGRPFVGSGPDQASDQRSEFAGEVRIGEPVAPDRSRAGTRGGPAASRRSRRLRAPRPNDPQEALCNRPPTGSRPATIRPRSAPVVRRIAAVFKASSQVAPSGCFEWEQVPWTVTTYLHAWVAWSRRVDDGDMEHGCALRRGPSAGPEQCRAP